LQAFKVGRTLPHQASTETSFRFSVAADIAEAAGLACAKPLSFATEKTPTEILLRSPLACRMMFGGWLQRGENDARFCSYSREHHRNFNDEFERGGAIAATMQLGMHATQNCCAGSASGATERQHDKNRAERRYKLADRLPILGRPQPRLRRLGASALRAQHLGH
jgi:hypothetical protein